MTSVRKDWGPFFLSVCVCTLVELAGGLAVMVLFWTVNQLCQDLGRSNKLTGWWGRPFLAAQVQLTCVHLRKALSCDLQLWSEETMPTLDFIHISLLAFQKSWLQASGESPLLACVQANGFHGMLCHSLWQLRIVNDKDGLQRKALPVVVWKAIFLVRHLSSSQEID